MEHWLPFCYETLETLFDYLPGAAVSLDHQAEEARGRGSNRSPITMPRGAASAPMPRGTAPLYRPLPPDSMFSREAGLDEACSATAPSCSCSPFRRS